MGKMLRKYSVKGVYESINKNGSVSYRIHICDEDPKNQANEKYIVKLSLDLIKEQVKKK